MVLLLPVLPAHLQVVQRARVVSSLKARIGFRPFGICTLEILVGDVGCRGGPDHDVLGRLVHIDHLVQWQVSSG